MLLAWGYIHPTTFQGVSISFLLLALQILVNLETSNNVNLLSYSSEGQSSETGLNGQVKVLTQLYSFLEAGGENLLSCFSQLLEAAHIAGLVALTPGIFLIKL